MAAAAIDTVDGSKVLLRLRKVFRRVGKEREEEGKPRDCEGYEGITGEGQAG